MVGVRSVVYCTRYVWPATALQTSVTSVPDMVMEVISGCGTSVSRTESLPAQPLASVTVTDANGCAGSDSVLLTLVPQPEITSITMSGTDVTLVWSAVAGQTYRVQYTTDLTPTITWTDVTGDVLATGATATKTDAFGAAPQRFYRVSVVCP